MTLIKVDKISELRLRCGSVRVSSREKIHQRRLRGRVNMFWDLLQEDEFHKKVSENKQCGCK
ncbi:MAG: hypothetical protein AAGA18_02855 [Verrucomicrobiota bacterium]